MPPGDGHNAFQPALDQVKFWHGAEGGPILQEIQMWMAPFPPPQAVVEYEAMLPGTWERLLKMAEEAQAADIRNAQNNQQYDRRDFRRGQLLGVLALLAAMAGAMYCVKSNQPWVAAAFLSMTVMAVARSFIEPIRDRFTDSHSKDGFPPSNTDA